METNMRLSLSDKLRMIFDLIIEDGDLSRVDEFYAEGYVEKINGDVKNLDDFKENLRNRPKGLTVSINTEKVLESGNYVGHMHQVILTEEDGTRKIGNVISMFEFTDLKKLIRCTEIVQF